MSPLFAILITLRRLDIKFLYISYTSGFLGKQLRLGFMGVVAVRITMSVLVSPTLRKSLIVVISRTQPLRHLSLCLG